MNYMTPDISNARWLWGVSAIAKHINRTHRQTAHMLAKGMLPVKKVGGRYVADTAALDAHLRGENPPPEMGKN